MNETHEPQCPECRDPVGAEPTLDRRNFIRVVGGAAAVAVAGGVPVGRAVARQPKPAEALIQELHATLDAEQKKTLVVPFDHGPKKGTPTRLGMYNGPVLGQQIAKMYTKGQQQLIDKIVRAMVSGEDGYRRISRNGKWDTGSGLPDCGCVFFGEPTQGQKYCWLFTGHHLTLRADGDFMDGAAWGGPMFYGHSPNGYSDKNVFNFQTKSVLEVFKALDDKQRAKAVAAGSPGEGTGSIRFRKPTEAKPGIGAADLTKDQHALIESVMRDLLSPYRKEDADEAMQIVKNNGGLDKLHLAFYRDQDAKDAEPWHFWRLEGPGFVWNYRVLPHVHCYVNIAAVTQ